MVSHSNVWLVIMSENTNDKKDIIVKTAIRLFTDNGFHGTPTSLIASESGVSNGTLFHYFPTKESLINYIYYDIKGQMAKDIGEGVSNERTVEGTARLIWRNAILWGVAHADAYLFIQQFGSSPYIKNVPPEEIMKDAHYAVEVFSELIQKSPLRGIEPVIAFNILFAPIDVVIRAIITSKEKQDTDLLIDSSFRNMWKSVSDD